MSLDDRYVVHHYDSFLDKTIVTDPLLKEEAEEYVNLCKESQDTVCTVYPHVTPKYRVASLAPHASIGTITKYEYPLIGARAMAEVAFYAGHTDIKLVVNTDIL